MRHRQIVEAKDGGHDRGNDARDHSAKGNSNSRREDRDQPFEPVSDVAIKHFGQPLIPLDTTVANVIAHQLIGEAFANQLDEAVHHAVDEMLNEESFALESVEAYRDKLKSPDTEAAWKRWPCLSRQLGVGLELDQPA